MKEKRGALLQIAAGWKNLQCGNRKKVRLFRGSPAGERVKCGKSRKGGLLCFFLPGLGERARRDVSGWNMGRRGKKNGELRRGGVALPGSRRQVIPKKKRSERNEVKQKKESFTKILVSFKSVTRPHATKHQIETKQRRGEGVRRMKTKLWRQETAGQPRIRSLL